MLFLSLSYLILIASSVAAQLTTSSQDSSSTTIAVTSFAEPASTASVSSVVYTQPIYDSWQCATKNISAYLQPPMPTGHMLDIYYDHSDKIYAECESKLAKPFTTFPACQTMAQESWCAVCFFVDG
jgi:exo-beta-1,3-glucanase (GH17 family)